MNEVAPTEAMSTRQQERSLAAMAAHAVDFLFYATAAALALKCTTNVSVLDQGLWLEALFLLTATASIILSTSRVIPFQNVALAAVVIGFVGTIAYTISLKLPWGFNFFFWVANLGRRDVQE